MLTIRKRHRRAARIIAALGLLLGVSATPARADWEFTHWGMSLDQVLAIRNHQISASIVNSSLSQGHLDQLAEGYFVDGETHFHVAYYFDSGKRLSMIALRLESADPIAADRVRSALIGRYGNSPARSVQWGDDWMLWRDAGHNNQIQFIYQPELRVIEVFYEPIAG